ncbi:MAG: GNAT family N-acetyltransferase [Lachnospiraceae bacterium]|nr:GNAT family N-acetyltransferase [Lachnospiraceae bacterium]
MDFRIEKANASDAEAIAAVIQKCYEKLEHKEWYIPDNADYLRDVLTPAQVYDETLPGRGNRGMGYKAVSVDKGDLAGIFIAAFPGDSPKSMGYDIGFDPEQCRMLAHMDSAAVLPRFRGFRLQYRLMSAAEEDLRCMGFHYLAATVHPDNHASKGTMLRLGYQVMTTKEKYNGNLRDILLKSLL